MTQHKRQGLTLLELVIVVAVLLILLTMVLTIVNLQSVKDKTADAANISIGGLRKAQAMAHKDGQARGVRLILSEQYPTYAVGMQIVGGPEVWTPPNESQPITVSTPAGSSVSLISDLPAFVEKGKVSGAVGKSLVFFINGNRYFAVDQGNGVWRTTRKVFEPDANRKVEKYTIEGLLPTPLNTRVHLFPKGTVIDLDNSVIPRAWKDAGKYISNLDIMFSPRGQLLTTTIDRRPSVVFLSIIDVKDLGKTLGDLSKEGSERIVTVHRNGDVGSAKVDLRDDNNNGIADSPFNYAHLGIYD